MKGGVEERKNQNTPRCSPCCVRTHDENIWTRPRFIQADPEHLNTEMQLSSSDLGSFRDALGFYRGIQFIRLY